MSDEKSDSVEDNTKNSKVCFSKAAFFILGNEFCEQFTYYAMQTILTLYLHEVLLYSENMSTTIYHIWKFLAYFTPVFGAMLADSWFGKFRTILYLSILYILGILFVSIGSIPNELKTMKILSFIGLIVVACGTGGIKPCVAAFGGDQYPPDKVEARKYFFSYFYFMLTAGSFFSTIVTPILRARVHCMRQNTCYLLAFGVPGILMMISVTIFILGKSMYRTIASEKNILLLFSSCICYAIAQRFRGKKKGKEHCLDYAEDKYDIKLINDSKSIMQVWFLMLPLPLFWALYDQQGSRWTLQATKLNGTISNNIQILPDQMQILNSGLLLIFIPLFEYIIYPMLSKIKILTKPLQRIIAGGLLAAISFFVAGLLNLAVEKDLSTLRNIEFNQMLVTNNFPCLVNTNITNNTSFFTFRIAQINTERESHQLKLIQTNSIASDTEDKILNILQRIQSMPKKLEGRNLKISRNRKSQAINDSKLKVFLSNKIRNSSSMSEKENCYVIFFNDSDHTLIFHEMKSNNLNPDYISTEKNPSQKKPKTVFPMKRSGDYVHKNHVTMSFKSSELTQQSSLSILYQIPQYIILTVGEILFSITSLEFSYSLAPQSMKSVVQASWLFTAAIGNLIMIFASQFETFQNQSSEFLAFSLVMAFDMIIFGIFAFFYTSRNVAVSQMLQRVSVSSNINFE